MTLTDRDLERTVRLLQRANTAAAKKEAFYLSMRYTTSAGNVKLESQEILNINALIEDAATFLAHGNGFELYGRDYCDHLEFMKKVR